MLKVLIADDEYKICQLIEKLIDWKSLDMEVAGTASNGIEALEKIRELSADIAITDIRMPGCDGLELIRKAKEVRPKIEFVIISGYRHFEYAQTAIRYGVSDYLLKPIRKEELTETLAAIRQRLREESEQLTRQERVIMTMKSDEERLRSNFLSGLIYRDSKVMAELKDLELVNNRYHFSFREGLFSVCIIKCDGRSLEEKKNLDFVTEREQSAIRDILTDAVRDFEILPQDSFLFILLNYGEEQKKDIRRLCREILEHVAAHGAVLDDIRVTVAVGETVDSLEAIQKSYRNARNLIEERLVSGTGRVLEGQTGSQKDFTGTELFSEFNRQMNAALESLSTDRVRNTILSLKEGLLSAGHFSGHEVLQMSREVCNLYLFFMKGHGIQVEDGFMERFHEGTDECAGMDELFDYMTRTICQSYNRSVAMKRQEDNRPVRQTRQYIREHYAEVVTLEGVSSVVGLAPTYLSAVFKKETGQTFLEFLSDTRMNAAKQLLKETNDPVAVVCEKVGYSDVRYFTKSFTRFAGLKPNEYRKLYS